MMKFNKQKEGSKETNTTWINLKISNFSSDLNEMCDLFLEYGALSTTVQGEDDGGDPNKSWFNEPGEPIFGNWTNKVITALFPDNTNIQDIIQKIQNEYSHEKLIFETKPLDDKNWIKHTQKIHKPLEAEQGIWIVAPWHKKKPSPSINIILDPGLGFGTGTHPTTYLCLNWICNNIQPGQSVLDYGCGSGILAVTASVLGAEPVYAIDIDQQAIDSTNQNADLNDQEIMTGHSDILKDRTFNIVIANILAKPLIELSSELVNYLLPGGTIILAGLLESQVEAVISAYDSRILLKQMRSKDKWALLVGNNPL